jgi:hypothetical protein
MNTLLNDRFATRVLILGLVVSLLLGPSPISAQSSGAPSPSASGAPDPSAAPSLPPLGELTAIGSDEDKVDDVAQCVPVCGYSRSMSAGQNTAEFCGATGPGEGLNRSAETVQSEEQRRANCAQRKFSEWGQSKTQCDALDVMTEAYDISKGMTIAYSAVAAGCWAACAFPYFTKACSIASVGVSAADVGVSIALMVKTKDKIDYTIGGWDGVATGAGGGILALTKLTTGTWGHRTGSCITAGIMSAIAIWKGITIKLYDDTRKVTCGRIMKLQSAYAQQVRVGTGTGPGAIGPGATSGQLGNTTGRGGPTGSGSITGNGGGGGSRRLSDQISENETGTPSALLSAASADTGVGGVLFNDISSKDHLGEVAKLAGLNLKDIARQVEAGRSPQQILSTATKIPNEVKALIAKIDPKKLTINGKPMMLASAAGAGASGYGMNLSSSSGGGAPKAAPGVDFGKMFGGKAGQPAGAPGSMSFGKKGDAETPGDIFHTGTTRTVFEIVTQKILKVDEDRRVQKLEWCTGINRAMHGLPNLGVEIRQCTPL